MAVFRIEKTKDFTIMCNYHLRDRRLSLKAKGLLTLMLSLPDDWDYTSKGLAHICKDGVDSISATLRELETYGYLIRQRIRLSNGRLGQTEYTIFEKPQKPAAEPIPPKRENPVQVFPVQASPVLENPAELNKDVQNTDPITEKREQNACAYDARTYRILIEDHIDYDNLVENYGTEKIDSIVELIQEVVVSDNPYCLIAKERLPRECVRSRMLKLKSDHIEYMLEQLDKTKSKVGNPKAYLLAALYNAPVSMEHHYQVELNHDSS